MEKAIDIDKTYELDDLIQKLEMIHEKRQGLINYPKAFLTLCLEIDKIKKLI